MSQADPWGMWRPLLPPVDSIMGTFVLLLELLAGGLLALAISVLIIRGIDLFWKLFRQKHWYVPLKCDCALCQRYRTQTSAQTGGFTPKSGVRLIPDIDRASWYAKCHVERQKEANMAEIDENNPNYSKLSDNAPKTDQNDQFLSMFQRFECVDGGTTIAINPAMVEYIEDVYATEWREGHAVRPHESRHCQIHFVSGKSVVVKGARAEAEAVLTLAVTRGNSYMTSLTSPLGMEKPTSWPS
jgi:hypothetical protein